MSRAGPTGGLKGLDERVIFKVLKGRKLSKINRPVRTLYSGLIPIYSDQVWLKTRPSYNIASFSALNSINSPAPAELLYYLALLYDN